MEGNNLGKARRKAWQKTKYWQRRIAEEEQQRAGWSCLHAAMSSYSLTGPARSACPVLPFAFTFYLVSLALGGAEAEARAVAEAAADAERGLPPALTSGFRVPSACVPDMLMVWEFTQVRCALVGKGTAVLSRGVVFRWR